MTRKWGLTTDWVKLFLSNRDGMKCYLCGNLEDKHCNSILIIEHKNNDETDFRPENLGLAHRSCNIIKNPRGKLFLQNALPQAERKRENVGSAGAEPEASSAETARAQTMRPDWNNWLPGFFNNLENPISMIPLEALARKAVHAIGKGSSITYRRYALEDVEGGILFLFKNRGVLSVSYREKETEMIHKQKEEEAGMSLENETRPSIIKENLQ